MKLMLLLPATVLAASLGLAAMRPGAQGPEKKGPFQVGEIWYGSGEQDNSDASWPAVLYVKTRKAEDFTGTAWYPTLDNGLLQVTGTLKPSGEVSLFETEVLHGASTPRKGGVSAGSRFNGKVQKGTLTCTGEYTNPENQKVVKLKLTLTRGS